MKKKRKEQSQFVARTLSGLPSDQNLCSCRYHWQSYDVFSLYLLGGSGEHIPIASYRGGAKGEEERWWRMKKGSGSYAYREKNNRGLSTSFEILHSPGMIWRIYFIHIALTIVPDQFHP